MTSDSAIKKGLKTIRRGISKFLLWVGVAASFMKKYWILTTTTAGSGVAIAVLPLRYVDPAGNPQSWVFTWLWILGGAIVISALLDKLADHFDLKTSESEAAKLEDLAETQIADLNSFIEQCASTSNLQGRSRQDHLDTLKTLLVIAASATLGKGTRASYYTLRQQDGKRVLDDPVHHLQVGRSDRSNTGFFEAKNPENSIWTLLDRDDTEPGIVEYGDDRDAVNWTKVKYRSYYSVPVKYKGTVYGFLSVNTLETGAFSESQRQAILGMARVYALTLLLAKKQTR